MKAGIATLSVISLLASATGFLHGPFPNCMSGKRVASNLKSSVQAGEESLDSIMKKDLPTADMKSVRDTEPSHEDVVFYSSYLEYLHNMGDLIQDMVDEKEAGMTGEAEEVPVSLLLPTVSDILSDFYDIYGMPLIPTYKTLIADFVATMFLGINDYRFTYDPIYAFGIHTAFYALFGGYPAEGGADKVFRACIKSMGWDDEQFLEDVQTYKDWVQGKTEEEFFDILSGKNFETLGAKYNEIEETLSPDEKLAMFLGNKHSSEYYSARFDFIRNDNYFKVTRGFAVSLYATMGLLGIDKSATTARKWLEALNVKPQGALDEYLLYDDLVNNMRSIEEMFKQIEIREKKKQAERLEEKAELAAKKAEEAARKAEEQARIAAEMAAEKEAEKEKATSA